MTSWVSILSNVNRESAFTRSLFEIMLPEDSPFRRVDVFFIYLRSINMFARLETQVCGPSPCTVDYLCPPPPGGLNVELDCLAPRQPSVCVLDCGKDEDCGRGAVCNDKWCGFPRKRLPPADYNLP
ncbi:hypothetical protein FOL47_000466 [Perkinsus chesapeaki]|uniref:WAP domain-containing protein n=1 Tax=Perkinsus chesapeaki TaxID=330153 RepID=A0A7J6MMA5_PERCH|nr:hypothetical protein FOL47_000466 [Perkinsus chesapeaki]